MTTKNKTLAELYQTDFETEIGKIYFDPYLEQCRIDFRIDETAFSENPLLWCDLFQDLVGDITRQYEEMLDMMRAINDVNSIKDLPI